MISREKIGIGKNHVPMLTTSADECLINSSPTCAQLSPGCKISNKTDRIDSLSLRLFLYARGTMYNVFALFDLPRKLVSILCHW